MIAMLYADAPSAHGLCSAAISRMSRVLPSNRPNTKIDFPSNGPCKPSESVYNKTVLETTSIGFGSPNVSRRTTAAWRYFFVRMSARASNYGWAWAGRLRPAGFLERRSSNLALCPPTPFGSGERVEPVLGGRIMRQSPLALTGQNIHTLIDEITRNALKRAAMAPTYMAALDITGAALIAVAMLAKSGVRHG